MNFHSVGLCGRGLETVNTENREDLTGLISKVCRQVITETNKDSTVRKQETGRSKFVKKTPENSPCHICEELGHWAKECPAGSDKHHQKSSADRPGKSQIGHKGSN